MIISLMNQTENSNITHNNNTYYNHGLKIFIGNIINVINSVMARRLLVLEI